MSGIGLILSTAKDALLTHQYAIDVTSHNVANVNTPGYTRQTPQLISHVPSSYGGFVFGRGVKLEDILREADNFVETRLRERETELAAMEEKEVYLNVLEGIFSESSSRGLSTQLSAFWNAWQDLTNNPSGPAEKNILTETGALLAQSFSDLSGDMAQFGREITLALDVGIDKVNELASQIATLNDQIINLQVYGNANDLKDRRNQAILELAKYMDINTHASEDGTLSVVLEGGFTLVDKASVYALSFEGGEIKWEGSGGTFLTITDKVTGGKLGGWLDVRDEILPKYTADLDELAKSVIFEVNRIHCQGVGSTVFQAGEELTGTYRTITTLADLTFGGEVDFSGTFKLWVGDANGENLQEAEIDLSYVNGPIGPIDGTSSLAELAASINDQITTKAGLTGVTASVSEDSLRLTADAIHTFAFSEDSSDILAALGLNTFFQGGDASGMAVNSVLESQKELVAAGKIDPATGEYAAGDNSNALAVVDLQYEEVTIKRWAYERGSAASSQDIGDTIGGYLHYLVGSVGIESQSIQRNRNYNELVVEQLQETRDNISAVSLDEEMINLMKYQHAYSAAAKLISTADEMLKTLLETK